MKTEYNWTHLEINEDLKFAFKSDLNKDKELAEKFSLLKAHLIQSGNKLNKIKRKVFFKEVFDIEHKNWDQHWRYK